MLKRILVGIIDASLLRNTMQFYAGVDNKQARRRYIRRLLIHGARATVARVRSGQMKNAWLSGLLSRRHFNVATVALANKTARVAWAVMSTEQAYRRAA